MALERCKAFVVSHGIPASQRDRAIRLFWQAFGGELYTVLQPKEKAIRCLSLVANSGGALVTAKALAQALGNVGFGEEKWTSHHKLSAINGEAVTLIS